MSGLPIARPNSMNNYGVILDEIGFQPFFDDLRDQFVAPLAKRMYPQEGPLVGHHAFAVKYKISEDLDLDFHYDSSAITINACLGKEFVGGPLYFRGLLHDPTTHDEDFMFNHQRGVSLLHRGKHRHGAMAITSGTRYNLIIWFQAAHVACECSDEQAHDHGHS